MTDTALASLSQTASTVQLPPGDWPTLLDGLCARFPRVPREQWLDRFARGRVLDAAGNSLGADCPYRVGSVVRYFREVAEESVVPFEEGLLHADAHLVVADKPHFLAVAPTGRHVHDTLLGRLSRRLDNPHLVPLHRLDRDTAGLVLFSAHPDTRGAYQALFRERRIVKEYRAIAPSLPLLDFPLERHSRLARGVPFFRMQEEDGEPNAHTRVEVMEASGPWWQYRLWPVSGRKHQLRVHMAALGAPIRHDAYYPALTEVSPQDYSRPLQLLARGLEFTDPLSGRARRFRSLRQLQA